MAAAFAAQTPARACREIGLGLTALFDCDTWYVLFFRRNETPIMYDYFDAETRYDRYVDGPYLVDPFYASFLRGDPPGCYLQKDIAPEDLSAIKAYIDYDCELFGPMDEVGLVLDLDEDTRSLVCFARAEARQDKAAFEQRHLQVLQTIAPVINAVITAVWADIKDQNPQAKVSRSEKHTRIEAIFHAFGSEQLTEREREVCNLMIKGFNAREIGDFLDITYGTARNHIKKVYQKLEVSSQSELCGLFIEQLLSRELP